LHFTQLVSAVFKRLLPLIFQRITNARLGFKSAITSILLKADVISCHLNNTHKALLAIAGLFINP